MPPVVSNCQILDAVRQLRNKVPLCISLFEIATVNRLVIERALGSKIRDFEDAVLDIANANQQAELMAYPVAATDLRVYGHRSPARNAFKKNGG